jgi:GTP diphosphokinase / guanosine-3',5'-bis(diphosphate) 3'-diphosphatase
VVILVGRHSKKQLKMEHKEILINIPQLAIETDMTPSEETIAALAFEQMLAAIKTDKDEADEYNIRKAFEVARRAHGKQRRKSGEPYLMHPIEVARICVQEFGLGATSAVAGLLHDVVEDTNVTQEDISREFGAKISGIVESLTKLGALTIRTLSESPESPQAENFKKILLTISKDVRVVLIKMADRLHNMRTLGSMPPHKQLKIAYETTFIYAPLAHRLGFYTIKGELEDLCLSITDKEQYDFVKQKLAETQISRDEYIDAFIAPLRKDLEAEGLKFNIYGRSKGISSIANKLKKKQAAFEEIYDLFAIRVIIDTPKEREKSACWNAYAVVTDHYTPVPERLKDWISTPKSNGYESLHTTVMGPKGRFVEVQIRTERMNEMAEMGFAAHWKYKGVHSEESIFEDWLNKAREMLENPNNDALEFLNDFKTSLFAEEIYVFTPKGDMKLLPKGATALDFAFEIHSELGYKCKSVKVDQRIVPLSYELKNGEQVSIITSNSQKPNEDWLKIVKTGKARSKIRQAIREERMQQSSYGKEALERKLKSLKIAFEENVDAIAKFYNCTSRHDLYYQIYLEDINLDQVKLLKVENGKVLPELVEPVSATNNKITTSISIEPIVSKRAPAAGSNKNVKPRISVEGEDLSTVAYQLSDCCNPVAGDPIFAYLSSKHNIKIHRSTCNNAEYLQAAYAHRVRKAEWIGSDTTAFTAELQISGMDDMGVVQHLSDIITNKLRINMRAFSMSGNEGHFEGKISVSVTSKDQLNALIAELKKLEEVQTVARIE